MAEITNSSFTIEGEGVTVTITTRADPTELDPHVQRRAMKAAADAIRAVYLKLGEDLTERRQQDKPVP